MKRVFRVLVSLSLVLSAAAGCSASYPSVSIDPRDVTTIVNPYGIAPLSALVVVSASSGIDETAVHRVDVSVTGPGGRTSTWRLSTTGLTRGACFRPSSRPRWPGTAPTLCATDIRTSR